MNPLIPIHQTALQEEPVSAVNARDLHAFLASGDKFADWIKNRIKKYDFLENQDFVIASANTEAKRGGHNRKDYFLSLDMAKELSMVERNAKGKRARQYFIECERRAKMATHAANAGSATALLNNPSAMRGLLLTYSEKVIDLEAKVEAQAPKVEFYDAVTDSKDGQTIQEVAKVLGIGPNRLFGFLRSDGLLTAHNLPYQAHLEAGYFVMVEAVSVDAGRKRAHARVLVTGKGVVYLQKRLKQWLCQREAGRRCESGTEEAP